MATPSERKKTYQQRKEEGLCPRCGGKRKKAGRYVFCDDCRAFYRKYNEKISEEIKKQRKKKYALRVKNRECPRCGKKLGKNYPNKICRPCLVIRYSYSSGKKRPKK